MKIKLLSNTVKSFTLSAFALVLLSGCGDSSSSSENIELTDMVGLWEQSTNINGREDLVFIERFRDGTFVKYDYMGDAFDTYINKVRKDCFTKNTGYLDKIGDITFTDGTNDYEISVGNNYMSYTYYDKVERAYFSQTDYAVRSDLIDRTKICK